MSATVLSAVMMVKLKRWKSCVPFAVLCDNIIMMLAIQSLNTWHSTDAWSNWMCFYRGNYCVVFFFLVYRLLWKQWAVKCSSPYGCQSALFDAHRAVCRRMWRQKCSPKKCTGWQTIFLHGFVFSYLCVPVAQWFFVMWNHYHCRSAYVWGQKLVQWSRVIWSN